MARRYSTLGDVIEQLKENNNSQLDTMDAVDSLTNVLAKQFVQQNKDALENRREAGAGKAKLASSSKSTTVASGNNINILGGGGILGGIGKLILGGGVGIGAAAAGLGAFFTMIAKVDKDFPNGGENIKKLLTNTADGLKAFTDRDLKAFGILLGTGALFGAISPIPGLRGVGAGIGIAAIGAGIAGFFAALGAGDMALNEMESTAANLKVFLTNLGEGLSALTTDNIITLGTLMGTGGALGLLFGVGKTAKAAFGIAAIGTGIAAFLTAFAGVDAISGVLGANGSNLGPLLKNIGEGLNAFSVDSLKAMAGLFAVGAIFGAIPGGGVLAAKASVGLGAVGFGIGAFLAGLAGAGKLASFLGLKGEGIKEIMKNIAAGMNELSSLPADIGTRVLALGGLGPAIAALYGGSGIGQLLDFAVDKLKTFSNFLFGTDFKDQRASRKSQIAAIVDSVTPLKNLDMKAISNLDKLSDAIGKFSDSISKLGKSNLSNFKDSVKRLIGGVKLQLDLLNAMAKGGKVGSGYFDGIPEADFGKGFLDPQLRVDDLVVLMKKTQDILNRTNLKVTAAPDLKVNPMSSSSMGGSINAGNSINSNNVSNTTYNSVGTNFVSPGPTVDLQDQFGFVTT